MAVFGNQPGGISDNFFADMLFGPHSSIGTQKNDEIRRFSHYFQLCEDFQIALGVPKQHDEFLGDRFRFNPFERYATVKIGSSPPGVG